MAMLSLTPEMAKTVLYASDKAGGRTFPFHLNLTNEALRDRHRSIATSSGMGAATAFISIGDAAFALSRSVNGLSVPFTDNFANRPDGDQSGDLDCATGLNIPARYGGGECRFTADRFFLVMKKDKTMPHALLVFKIYPLMYGKQGQPSGPA